MVEGGPDSRIGALVVALGIKRNAAIGAGVGVAVAIFAYAYRVARLGGPTADSRGSPLLFFLLAVVLAANAGALVTVLLTARAAIRAAREE